MAPSTKCVSCSLMSMICGCIEGRWDASRAGSASKRRAMLVRSEGKVTHNSLASLSRAFNLGRVDDANTVGSSCTTHSETVYACKEEVGKEGCGEKAGGA